MEQLLYKPARVAAILKVSVRKVFSLFERGELIGHNGTPASVLDTPAEKGQRKRGYGIDRNPFELVGSGDRI